MRRLNSSIGQRIFSSVVSCGALPLAQGAPFAAGCESRSHTAMGALLCTRRAPESFGRRGGQIYKRYRLQQATIAMFEEGGCHVAHHVPVGSIIMVDGALDGDKLMNVLFRDPQSSFGSVCEHFHWRLPMIAPMGSILGLCGRNSVACSFNLIAQVDLFGSVSIGEAADYS